MTILPATLNTEGQMTGYVTIIPQSLEPEAQVIVHLTILPTTLNTEGQMTGYVTLILGNPQEAQIIGLLTILP